MRLVANAGILAYDSCAIARELPRSAHRRKWSSTDGTEPLTTGLVSGWEYENGRHARRLVETKREPRSRAQALTKRGLVPPTDCRTNSQLLVRSDVRLSARCEERTSTTT